MTAEHISPDSAAPAVLPRRLGAWSAGAVVIGLIVGSGIFRTPATVAEMLGTVGGVAAVWTVAGLVTLCLALCLAELATMFPRAGGLYVYLREAFGPAVAFVYGWVFLLVNPAAWAGIALICAEYVSALYPLTAVQQRLAATAAVSIVTVANYFSVALAAALQSTATLAKLLALAVIAGVIFASGDGAGGALAGPVTFHLPSAGVFGTAVVAALWAYEGAAAACAGFGEVRDPGRTLPRALVLGVGVVVVLYLVINAAYLYALPMRGVASSGSVAADAMRAVVGPFGAAIVAACAIVATFGALASTAMVDPRVFFAMARDGAFLAVVGRIHPRRQTPHVAVLTCGALAVLYLWIRSFEQLAAQFVLGMWLFYVLAVLGLFRLRAARPAATRPYRVPGYPVVPAVFLLAALGLLASALVELPLISLTNLAVVAAGVPVYLIWRRFIPAGGPG